MKFTKTEQEIQAEKERFFKMLQSRGVQVAQNELTQMINLENRNNFVNNQPQNAKHTNPLYSAIQEVIDSYKAALEDKEEMFKQFVLNHKEFKQWLAAKEGK